MEPITEPLADPRRPQAGHRRTPLPSRLRPSNQDRHEMTGARQLDRLPVTRTHAGRNETDFHTYRTRPNGPKFNKPSGQRTRRRESVTARSRIPPGDTTGTMPPLCRSPGSKRPLHTYRKTRGNRLALGQTPTSLPLARVGVLASNRRGGDSLHGRVVSVPAFTGRFMNGRSPEIARPRGFHG